MKLVQKILKRLGYTQIDKEDAKRYKFEQEFVFVKWGPTSGKWCQKMPLTQEKLSLWMRALFIKNIGPKKKVYANRVTV